MKKIVFIFMMIISLCLLTSCFKEKIEDNFNIVSSNTTYFVSKNDNKQIKLSIGSDSVLEEHNLNNIEFVVNDNTCGGQIVKLEEEYYFTADKLGSAIISAWIGDLHSNNTITIYARNEQEYVSNKLLDVLDTTGGVVFGEVYDLGLGMDDITEYSLRGAEGILEINSDGKLDVKGIGQGKISLYYGEEMIKEARYTVYNSILSTKIKEDLISKGIISSRGDLVTNDMLENITNLDLSGELINDESAKLGVKHLSNLSSLNLSHNALEDVDFISSLSNLVSLDLSDNNFSDISSIIENENLEYVNLSDNKLKDITKLQYLYKIKYLDLSNNSITNISPLSSCYSLESLYLNNNKLENFKDSLSGLEYLKELAVGYCGISFTDIISLQYLPNIEYLDISGSNPTVSTIANTMTNLESLILRDCSLSLLGGSDSLEHLNKLTNLKTLDISNNGLDLETWSGSNGEPLIKGESFSSLEKLAIGGNEFSIIPDLTSFKNLKTLDLTGSYNISSISSLTNLKIEELILDECNSLYTDTLLKDIEAFENLNRLSTLGAFSYLDRVTYSGLEALVKEDKISWRFLNEVWTTSKTVSNYTKSIYFSMNELISASEYNEETKEVTLKFTGNEELILVFMNEDASVNDVGYTIVVPKEFMRFQVYGSKYNSFRMSFNLLERKEKSFTINLYNFSFYRDDCKTPIMAQEGSKLIINSCLGDNEIKGSSGKEPTPAINCYDLNINVLNNSTLTIKGGDGANGVQGKYGTNGTDGAAGVVCNSCKLLGIITINGGNGGTGGYGKGEFVFLGDCSGYGGNGGNGGNSIIAFSSLNLISSEVVLNGGYGGAGGGAESWAAAAVYPGSRGENGVAIIVKTN